MKPNHCRGFTFVEILIALTLLAVVAAPLLQMFAVSVEQVAYADDLRTALDLAREEVEKVKNLALTENQLKALGNAISPPIRLNQRVWYAVRVVDPVASPLEIQVYVFRERLTDPPIVSLATIVSK